MGKRFDYGLEKEIDRAIAYLSQNFAASGHNSKPVILHSIRVCLKLFDLGYERDLVLAGILHDILEDTDVSSTMLCEQFGSRITEIVKAVTFDPSIESKREQNLEMFNRCKIYGIDALIVKCADIYDNIDYFVPTKGYEELAGILLEKYRLFLSTAQDALHNEPLFDALKGKVMHAELQMREFTSGS